MGSRPRIPKKTAQELRVEKMQAQLLALNLRDAKKPQHLPEMIVPDPVKPAPPPPSAQSTDVQDAARAARAAAARRQGYGKTQFASALGGQPSALG